MLKRVDFILLLVIACVLHAAALFSTGGEAAGGASSAAGQIGAVIVASAETAKMVDDWAEAPETPAEVEQPDAPDLLEDRPVQDQPDTPPDQVATLAPAPAPAMTAPSLMAPPQLDRQSDASPDAPAFDAPHLDAPGFTAPDISSPAMDRAPDTPADEVVEKRPEEQVEEEVDAAPEQAVRPAPKKAAPAKKDAKKAQQKKAEKPKAARMAKKADRDAPERRASNGGGGGGAGGNDKAETNASGAGAENAASAGDRRASLVSLWGASIRSGIAARKEYPRRSQQRRERGRVVIFVTVRRDGALISARVQKSSGYERLDEAALEAARRGGPYKPAPAGLDGETENFTIPMDFTPPR